MTPSNKQCVLRNLGVFLAGVFIASITGCAVEPSRGPDLLADGKYSTPWGRSQSDCQKKVKAAVDADPALPAAKRKEILNACLLGEAEKQCKARGQETQNGSQRGFTRTAIRWACADVAGVDTQGQDSRGQEYCEYYAAIQLPPEEKPAPMASTPSGQTDPNVKLPPPITPGRFLKGGVDPLAIELTEHQIEVLSDDESAVVGQCIFSSWHQDIAKNYPKCPSGANDATCARLPLIAVQLIDKWSRRPGAPARRAQDPMPATPSLPLTPAFFQMKVGFNSNNAAVDLVDECLVNPNAKLAGVRTNHFERACMHMFSVFTTHWRRSDPSVCAASMRLAECNCGVDVNGDKKLNTGDLLLGQKDDSSERYEKIARALVSEKRRGFLLGTWGEEDGLPPNCRYVQETGEDPADPLGNFRTLVACDIPAGAVVNRAEDIKEWCRETYANDVVVHVPIPADQIVCEPKGGDNGTAESCGNQPWVLGQENSRATAEAENPSGPS
jgi:hypothetical protein